MNQAQALKIVGDPSASEDEWLHALEILDNKVPSITALEPKKSGTILHRLSTLIVLYTCALLITNVLGRLAHPYMHDYSFLECFLFGVCWGTIEVLTGLGSIVLVIALVLGHCRIAFNDPTLPLLLVSLVAYRQFGWKPIFNFVDPFA